MGIEEAGEKLDKERTDAARLAEVRAADRHRAEVAMQSQNEERNRAPATNEKFPELVRQTEYGGIQNDAPMEGEQGESEGEGEEPETQYVSPGQRMRDLQDQTKLYEQAEKLNRQKENAMRQKQTLWRRMTVRRSEQKIAELNKKIEAGKKKLNSQKTISRLNCLLMCIPGLGWIMALLMKILSTKSKVEAKKAEVEISKSKIQINLEKNKLQSELKKQQQQMRK